jgi:hypothetical protein
LGFGLSIPDSGKTFFDLRNGRPARFSSSTHWNRVQGKPRRTPGCGMGNVLKADVERKLARLPEVKQVTVQVVFDPPWHPGRMSEGAKLQLGLDLDQHSNPVVRISR